MINIDIFGHWLQKQVKVVFGWLQLSFLIKTFPKTLNKQANLKIGKFDKYFASTESEQKKLTNLS